MLGLKIHENKKWVLKDSLIFWLDTETTGLDPYWNDMITACFLVEKDGEVRDSFEMAIQPFLWEKITEGAEKVHGITRIDLKDFNMPERVFKDEFIPFLKNHYRGKQFILAGHNVMFDRRHLNFYWGKCKSRLEAIPFYSPAMLQELSSLDAWFNENMIDTMLMAKFCQKRSLTNFINRKTNKPSVKLEVICQDFGIEYDSHDATDDIIATKIVAHRLWNRIETDEKALLAFQKQYPFMYNMFKDGYIKPLEET